MTNLLKPFFTAAMLLAAFALLAQNAGELDASFGEEGLAILSPVGSNSMDNAQCVDIRPTGEIVFAGVSGGFSGFGMTVGQVLPDGTMDMAFGTDGVTTIEGVGGSNFGYDIEVLADGKLLVCGAVSLTAANTAMAVWRFMADGELDASFGDNGALIVDVDASEDYARDILMDGSGQITVVGNSKQPDNFLYRAAMIRFDESGILDGNFGIYGTQVYPMNTDMNCDVRAGVMSPTGEIYLAGYTTVSSTSQPIVMGFSNFGEPLESFGEAGIFNTGVEGRYFDVDFANNGLIAVGDGNNGASGVVRAHNLTGEINPYFGDSGTALVSGAPGNALLALEMQADGKILVAGSASMGFMMRDFLVARLHPSGFLDEEWGQDGVTVTEVGPGFEDVNDLAIQPDGKIVAAGFAQFNNNEYVFARYGSGELGEIMGCTEPEACNYNPNATSDDGTCYSPGDACDDGDDETENDTYNENCDCVGEPMVNGLSAIQADGFQLFPNPAVDRVTLRFQSAQPRSLLLRTLAGERVLEMKLTSEEEVIAMSGLVPGVYTLSIADVDQIWVERLIIH